ncbi:MAG TPA: hypothetical protein VK457_01585, partial [Chloroflexota bacterium]|nr:hypothetical protein [Chloroflexota bacterium]
MTTRRQFLTAVSGAAALALLAACGQAAQPSTPASVAASAAAPSTVPAGPDPRQPVMPKLTALEQELALPQSVLDAARKEGKLSWVTSIDDVPAKTVMEVFRKRYPDIE